MTEGAYRCRGNCYLTERCSLTRTCLSNLLSVALFVEEAPPSALSTALFLPLTSTPLELLPPFTLPSQCESVLAVLEPGSVVLVVLLPYFCPPTALGLEWWWEVDPKVPTLWGLFFWEPAWLLSGSKSPQLDDLKWFFCRTSVSPAFDSFAGLWGPLTLPFSPISLADRVSLLEGNTLPLVGAFVEVSGDGFDLVAETLLSLCRWSFFSDAMDATNNRITRRKPERKISGCFCRPGMGPGERESRYEDLCRVTMETNKLSSWCLTGDAVVVLTFSLVVYTLAQIWFLQIQTAMSVRSYNPSVRVGNWNEDLCLEEVN